MKVGMKEDMDVANKMTLPNLVSRSMRNHTHSDDIRNGIMPKRTFSSLWCLKGRIVMKMCMKDMGVVDEMTSSTKK